MGLDIQFYKTKKQDWKEYQHNENPSIDDGTLSLLEVAYFRKVNFLVRYFQYKKNLSLEKISTPKVQLLLDYCTKVLGDRSEETSKKLLPTQDGFFFGSTEYDQWYYEDVERVYETFKEILDDLSDDEDLFMCCWW